MSKTSWSTEHLRQLKEITNHKVIYDGYEFVWLSKIDNKWQRHYIDNFKDYNKPMSWIYFNINKWNKEYEQRSLSYMKNMQLDLEIEVRITEISREANIKTKEKIEEIVKLKPSINNQEIADILGVTVRTVRRIRDK
jgi:hypothetical protein